MRVCGSFTAFVVSANSGSMDLHSDNDSVNVRKKDGKVWFSFAAKDDTGRMIVQVTDNDWDVASERPVCWEELQRSCSRSSGCKTEKNSSWVTPRLSYDLSLCGGVSIRCVGERAGGAATGLHRKQLGVRFAMQPFPSLHHHSHSSRACSRGRFKTGQLSRRSASTLA